jgi:DNA polymerase I-like protein with 3'-5' exonuclease and polymerase domains
MLSEIGAYRADFQPWKSPHGRLFTTRFALDIETTLIVGHDPPDYVLAAATDGNRGVFLTPDAVADFLLAHWGDEVILHNASFDLAVLDRLFQDRGVDLDVYRLVDERRLWDTMILHKLHGLATAGHTHQGKDRSTLERCASLHLGVELPKDLRDADGHPVRTSWGRWHGRPPQEIPPVYLDYLGRDVLATFGVFTALHEPLYRALDDAHEAFGHAGHDWLDRMTARYGVQTHDLQVMGAVALDHVERAGIGLDLANRDEIVAQVQRLCDDLREELRRLGYLAGEEGCDKALQALIRRTLAERPGIEIPRTATGKFSTAGEDLDELAEVSEFFARYKEHKQVSALLKNYLRKMDAARLHPHYDLLKNTGRTSASSPNIQNIPRQRKKKRPDKRDAFDLRRCFAPAAGKVFYVADYSSIELRTLAQTVLTQFGLGSVMARKLNEGVDLHRFVAARMKVTGRGDAPAILADGQRYAEFMASLSDQDRGAAKPANFGLPAGMGEKRLKDYARVQYEQPYTEEDAAEWKRAWLASFPEMVEFLKDRVDAGLLLARELGLTPQDFAEATGRPNHGLPDEPDRPAGWLGLMAFKVLRVPRPETTWGREYTPEELDYFWRRLQPLAGRLDARLREDLVHRRAAPALCLAVKRLVNRAGVFTITGRLRARASYSAQRNTTFQGAASDGAKLALYRLWRAGFRVVAFIHDEVVVEVDAGADLAAVKRQIDGILIDAMREICPDVTIEVEGSFRRRWGKNKQDEIPVPAGHESVAQPA